MRSRLFGALRGRAAGYSLPELLLTLGILGLILGLGATAWMRSQGRMQTATSARQLKTFLQRARMQAIFQGVDHFLLFDPTPRRLALFADRGSESGIFDADDLLVAQVTLARGIQLALPTTLQDPISGTTLTSAWNIPAPSGGAWKSGQRGVMVTSRGVFRTAVDEPVNITSGTIVLSSAKADAVAVTLRGSLGTVRAFEFLKGHWTEL